jgi:hypothetical protein
VSPKTALIFQYSPRKKNVSAFGTRGRNGRGFQLQALDLFVGAVFGRSMGLREPCAGSHKSQLGWRSNIWNGPAANHLRYSRFAGLTEIANGAVSFGISYDQWIAENFRIRRRLTSERSNRRTALGVSLVRRLGRPAASAKYASRRTNQPRHGVVVASQAAMKHCVLHHD